MRFYFRKWIWTLLKISFCLIYGIKKIEIITSLKKLEKNEIYRPGVGIRVTHFFSALWNWLSTLSYWLLMKPVGEISDTAKRYVPYNTEKKRVYKDASFNKIIKKHDFWTFKIDVFMLKSMYILPFF